MRKIITLSLLLCAAMLSAQTTPGKHSIKILDVNTKYADFGLSFFGDDKVVFASPTEKVSIVRKVWRENDQPYLDLFMGDIDSTGQIINKRPIKGDVNKKLHEAMVTFTKDYKTVYFSANNYNSKNKSVKSSKGWDNIQLYKADVNPDNTWTNIVKLPFNSDEFQTGLPTLNEDETKMYFVSDRPGSIGKTDIYVVDIYPDGTYGEPKNMGPRINTEEREMFPHMGKDNMLYFSSNGHPGYGNLDVFVTKIYDNTVSIPLNLEEPINSEKDDFSYIMRTDRQGYFSSNRSEGKGDDDIYSFMVDEPIFIECLQTVKGVVKNRDTDELIPGALVTIYDSEGNVLQQTAADEINASYSFDIPCNATFKITSVQDGFVAVEEQIKTINDLDGPVIEQDLLMSPEFVIVGDEVLVNINRIYFDFDKSNIRKDAAEQLDRVVEVMNKYPEMKIMASSHTDSRGPKAYNMKLSERRAKSTVDYIISKGIDASRIKSQGFGESKLVNKCSDGVPCSKEEHQLNRRTEFKIDGTLKVRAK
ncbi:OmpA family protein [Flavobacteriaceae bacterium F08102]|nr:OmpA family protein [Flavobacteriaceae bacterium F08102]